MGSFLQTQVHFIGFDVIPEKYMINAHGDILMATSTVPQQTLPGPSALPLLGNGANLLKLFRDPCTYSRWLHDTYGDVVAMAYGQMPKGAKWILAVASTDGTKAVNVIVHDSIGSVKSFFEEHADPFGATEYFEADRVSGVGLPKG
jgi:hypothetical protein